MLIKKLFSTIQVSTNSTSSICYNTDKFFAEESPAEQFSGQLKQLPPEIQQQIIPMFAQQLQQMQQQQQIRQQQAEMQAQAQKHVQMQQLRDNARAELEAQAMGISQLQ